MATPLLHAGLQDRAANQALAAIAGPAGELYHDASNGQTILHSVDDGPGTAYPRSLELNQADMLDWAAWPLVVDTAQAHSYCFWFKATAAPSAAKITHTIWATNDQFTTGYDHTNASYRNAATRAPNSFPFATLGAASAGNWVHNAVIWNTTHMITYRHGVQAASTATATGGTATAFVVLANRQAHDRGAAGRYADLRVFQAALTVDEILEIIAEKDAATFNWVSPRSLGLGLGLGL